MDKVTHEELIVCETCHGSGERHIPVWVDEIIIQRCDKCKGYGRLVRVHGYYTRTLTALFPQE